MKTATVIGAGRLGTTLARALSREGYEIRYLCCRTPPSARESVRFAGAGVPTTDAVRAARAASIVFLCVPDDEIARTARRLAASSVNWKGKTVIHTSGLHAAGILAPLKKKGAATISLHPIQTFPRKDSGPDPFRGTSFGLEGDPGAGKTAREIVRKLGGKVLIIEPDEKPLYHAAFVLASGGTAVLLESAVSLLESAGLGKKKATRILLSLANETLRNVKKLGAERGLTGPFARGDVRTIRAHLRALSGRKAVSELYRTLGLKSLGIAKKRNVPETRIRALKKILLGG